MNQRTILALIFAAASGVFAAPSPIDPGTAHVVALNSNMACSNGSCTSGNSSVLETQNANNISSMSSSAPAIRYNAWSASSLAVVAVGGFALSSL